MTRFRPRTVAMAAFAALLTVAAASPDGRETSGLPDPVEELLGEEEPEPEPSSAPQPRPSRTEEPGDGNQPSGPPEDVPANDRSRGLVYDGLRRSGHPACDGLFELVSRGPGRTCTPGPDPATDGTDVTTAKATPVTTEQADAGAAAFTCVGDGSSGHRIHGIYAVASDREDRYAQFLESMQTWAADAQVAYRDSAAKVGGEAILRWAHTPTDTDGSCTPVIDHVVLSPTGDDNVANTVEELIARGYDDTTRKYHVWVDANVYCGIGYLWRDDQPDPALNKNNVSQPEAMFARTDEPCWGQGRSEVHEITHTLGGVQNTAPHASADLHCTDEFDVMCYDDDGGTDTNRMTYPCEVAHNRLLDCGNDDYFHPDPPAGSYLASHWNVADSAWLDRTTDTPDPQPEPEPDPSEPVDQQALELQIVDGRVEGDLAALRSPDGAVLTVTERESGGRPDRRTSQAEARFRFDVRAGELIEVVLRGQPTTASPDDDAWRLEWSPDARDWTPLAVLEDGTGTQVVGIAARPSGTVWLRLVDTDRGRGQRDLDAAELDLLLIRTHAAADVSVPVAPSDLQAVALGSSEVELTWTDQASDESGFVIERSTDAGATWTEAGTVGADVVRFVDRGLDAATTYAYRVSAYNSAGRASSPTVTVRTDEVRLTVVFVGDLDGSTSGYAGRDVTVEIAVMDEFGDTVAGAAVRGSWSTDADASCSTNGKGTCTVKMRRFLTEPLTFTVTSVSAQDREYDPTRNRDPDGDSDGTRITVG